MPATLHKAAHKSPLDPRQLGMTFLCFLGSLRMNCFLYQECTPLNTPPREHLFSSRTKPSPRIPLQPHSSS